MTPLDELREKFMMGGTMADISRFELGEALQRAFTLGQQEAALARRDLITQWREYADKLETCDDPGIASYAAMAWLRKCADDLAALEGQQGQEATDDKAVRPSGATAKK